MGGGGGEGGGGEAFSVFFSGDSSGIVEELRGRKQEKLKSVGRKNYSLRSHSIF